MERTATITVRYAQGHGIEFFASSLDNFAVDSSDWQEVYTLTLPVENRSVAQLCEIAFEVTNFVGLSNWRDDGSVDFIAGAPENARRSMSVADVLKVEYSDDSGTYFMGVDSCGFRQLAMFSPYDEVEPATQEELDNFDSNLETLEGLCLHNHVRLELDDDSSCVSLYFNETKFDLFPCTWARETNVALAVNSVREHLEGK